MNTLGLVVVAKDAAGHIEKLLKQARYYADKVYIFVDSKTTDNTYEVCEPFCDHIEHIKTQGYIESVLPYVYSVPDTSHILRLDTDELLGEWFFNSRDEIMELLVDVMAFPRYAMVGDNCYLANEPMYPDLQTRMFRKGKVKPSTVIHCTPKSEGVVMDLRAHIFHMKYLWKSREEREALTKHYDSIFREAGSGPVYIQHQLPEEYYKGQARECEERLIDPDVRILNLGCGKRPRRGCLNVDSVDVIARYPERFEGIDFTQYDLNNLPWPWPDEAFGMIVMEDVLEHLKPDTLDIFNELWRIMKPAGILKLRCPDATKYGAYQDMTHIKWLVRDSFWHLDPSHEFGHEFSHYTPYKWHVIKAEDEGSYSFVAELTKLGGE